MKNAAFICIIPAFPWSRYIKRSCVRRVASQSPTDGTPVHVISESDVFLSSTCGYEGRAASASNDQYYSGFTPSANIRTLMR